MAVVFSGRLAACLFSAEPLSLSRVCFADTGDKMTTSSKTNAVTITLSLLLVNSVDMIRLLSLHVRCGRTVKHLKGFIADQFAPFESAEMSFFLFILISFQPLERPIIFQALNVYYAHRPVMSSIFCYFVKSFLLIAKRHNSLL